MHSFLRAGLLKLIRNQNPSLVTSYSGHVQNATVARISPSGYYCASGDVSGTGKHVRRAMSSFELSFLLVRIWDIVGEDQTLKGEYKVISGAMQVSTWAHS